MKTAQELIDSPLNEVFDEVRELDIGKVKKNDITDIVVRIDNFGGNVGVSIREFTTSDRYTGFTRSGTRVSNLEDFQLFKKLINSIDENLLTPKEKQRQPTKEVVKEVVDIPEESMF